MGIKAIIFDYGGVIGDDPYWTWLGKNIENLDEKREYFHKISLAVDACEISTEEFVRGIAVKAGMPDEKVEREIRELLKVYPEVKSLLAELKPKYKIALLSNFIFDWLDPVLRSNDLYQFFDVPIISTTVRMRKPDPEIYKLTLSKLGIDPGESIFIDDRPKNLETAEKLGMKTILFSSPQELRGQLLELLPEKF